MVVGAAQVQAHFPGAGKIQRRLDLVARGDHHRIAGSLTAVFLGRIAYLGRIAGVATTPAASADPREVSLVAYGRAASVVLEPAGSRLARGPMLRPDRGRDAHQLR